MLWKKGQFRFK